MKRVGHHVTQFENLRQPLKTLASRAKKGIYLSSSRPLIPVETDQRGPVQHEWESVGTRLSELESEQLAAEFKNGLSVDKLAETHGLHRATVYRHLKKHGTEPYRNSLDEVHVDRAKELYEAGHTLLEVAQLIGASYRAVREAFVVRGIPRRAPLQNGKKQSESALIG